MNCLRAKFPSGHLAPPVGTRPPYNLHPDSVPNALDQHDHPSFSAHSGHVLAWARWPCPSESTFDILDLGPSENLCASKARTETGPRRWFSIARATQ